jgi:hypothetical protein
MSDAFLLTVFEIVRLFSLSFVIFPVTVVYNIGTCRYSITVGGICVKINLYYDNSQLKIVR